MGVDMNYILRRKKLGHGSCKGIVENSKTGLLVYRNDNLPPPTDDAEYVFRWGCTSSIPGHPIIVNKAEAIHWVNNKKTSRKAFALEGLAPFTMNDDWKTIHHSHFPVIVRPLKHSQGRKLWYCQVAEELTEVVETIFGNDSSLFYISTYIPKVKEYRVFIAQGRAVWVANKIPANPEAIAWNVAQGGKFENVRWKDWPLDVVETAIKCFNISGLDFGGVDIMVDADGNSYCLEINSAPSQTSPYRQKCVAKVFDYIINNGIHHIPVGGSGKYRKYIHPAIDEEAIV